MFATIIAGTTLVRWCVDDGVLLCTWRGGGGGGIVTLHRCVVMAPASPVLFRISWFPFQSSSGPIDREKKIVLSKQQNLLLLLIQINRGQKKLYPTIYGRMVVFARAARVDSG